MKLGVKFLGVNLLNIPDLENCFQMNINVFQLLENQTVITHYKSLSNFEGTMYLDLQNITCLTSKTSMSMPRDFSANAVIDYLTNILISSVITEHVPM